MILTVHHVQIIVPREQEDEARVFYTELLGLLLIPKAPVLAKRGGFWLEAGVVQIHVGVADTDSIPKTRAHVAYQVKNLSNIRNRIEAAEIPCKDGVPIPGMNRFEIRDPFGNRVEFIELT